jgi:hypothetical protein
MNNVALRLSTPAGVNLTLMLQLAPAASAGLQLLVCAKSVPKAPPIETALMDMEDGLMFLSVTVCGALVTPGCCVGKAKLDGDRLTAGVTLSFALTVYLIPGLAPSTVMS